MCRANDDAVCSTREKIVKFLQSNPVQILLCVIVLLDAGVVIAQILLDLNSVKGTHTHTPYIRRSVKVSGRYVHSIQAVVGR